MELYHHGVKGMKWGVITKKDSPSSSSHGTMKISELKAKTHLMVKGKKTADFYIEAGVTLSRIQTKKEFENLPYFATYKKNDIRKYEGLFGNNLQKRAKYSDNPDVNIYKLEISSKSRLKVPSEQNASKIMSDILKTDHEFKQNLIDSINDSATKMKRPNQQELFRNANKLLQKDLHSLTEKDHATIYKALNLTLTNHEPFENAVQNTFYSALKKNGYSAIVDVNDSQYSSYHASKPVIVFDTNRTKLMSASNMDPKRVDRLYKVYNTERAVREAVNSVKLAKSWSNVSVKDAIGSVNKRYNNYYGVRKAY